MTYRNAYDLLTPHQAGVVRMILDREPPRSFAVALSGSHAYGFPSPDSDVDVKAIHLDPIAMLVGLHPGVSAYNHVGTFDGVKVDHTSNELGGVLKGVLQGNGSYVERTLGGLYFRASPLLDEMQDLLRRALSRRVGAYYAGFARGLLRQMTATESRLKGVLHVMRTLLTGTHLLRTGEVVLDLPALLSAYGLGDAMYLVEAKRAGAAEVMAPGPESDGWIPRAFDLLEEARESSPLPPDPRNESDVNEWLVEVRLRTA